MLYVYFSEMKWAKLCNLIVHRDIALQTQLILQHFDAVISTSICRYNFKYLRSCWWAKVFFF